MDEQAPKEKKNRIGNSELFMLIPFAVVFDLLSLIPGVNVVVVVIAQFLLALFFRIHKVNVLSKKRLVTFIIATIAEAIPVLSILPALTIETIIMVAITRAEDKTGIQVPGNISVSGKK